MERAPPPPSRKRGFPGWLPKELTEKKAEKKGHFFLQREREKMRAGGGGNLVVCFLTRGAGKSEGPRRPSTVSDRVWPAAPKAPPDVSLGAHSWKGAAEGTVSQTEICLAEGEEQEAGPTTPTKGGQAASALGDGCGSPSLPCAKSPVPRTNLARFGRPSEYGRTKGVC